jgi:hypothetical protein
MMQKNYTEGLCIVPFTTSTCLALGRLSIGAKLSQLWIKLSLCCCVLDYHDNSRVNRANLNCLPRRGQVLCHRSQQPSAVGGTKLIVVQQQDMGCAPQ